MATDARGSVYLGVIELGRQPAGNRMANTAGLTGYDVVVRFARGVDLVMAALATALQFIVVHGKGLGKAEYIMAAVTLVRGADMAIYLAGGDYPIVTITTGTGDFIVIDLGDSGKIGCRRGMTGLAQLGGRHVVRWFSGFLLAIMAGNTGAGDLGVYCAEAGLDVPSNSGCGMTFVAL